MVICDKSITEVLAALKDKGIVLTKTQVEYFQKHHLVPKAAKRKGGTGRGLYGYNLDEFTRAIKQVLKHRETMSIPKIKVMLMDKKAEQCLKILKTLGINDWVELEEVSMLGIPFNQKMYLARYKNNNRGIDPMAVFQNIRTKCKWRLLRQIELWWTEEEIKIAIMFYMIDCVENAETMLLSFRGYIAFKKRAVKDKNMIKFFDDLLADFSKQGDRLHDLRLDVYDLVPMDYDIPGFPHDWTPEDG